MRLWGHREERRKNYTGAFKTREEAIADGRATYGEGETFWIASGMPPTPESLVPDADEIVERISEQAYDVASEAAEEFPQLSDEAKAELDELLEGWAKKHLDVNFWVQEGDAEKIEPV